MSVLVSVAAIAVLSASATCQELAPFVRWASSPTSAKEPVLLQGWDLQDAKIVACGGFGLLNASCTAVHVLPNRTSHSASVLLPPEMVNQAIQFYGVSKSCDLASIHTVERYNHLGGDTSKAFETHQRIGTEGSLPSRSSAVVGCSVGTADPTLFDRPKMLGDRFDPPFTRPSWTNAPDAWFALGDRGVSGFTAGPGGWLKVIGRALAFDQQGECIRGDAPEIGPGAAQVQLWFDSSIVARLNANRSTCYDLHIDIGGQMEANPGLRSALFPHLDRPLYMSVTNRAFGEASMQGTGPVVADANGTQIVARAPRIPVSPRRVINVLHDFGGNVSRALLAAARSLDGADVVLSADHVFPMADGEIAVLGNNVTLRGENNLTSVLRWSSNSAMPANGAALLTLNGTYARADTLCLDVVTPAGPAILMAGNQTIIVDVNVRVDRSQEQIGNLLRVSSTDGFEVRNSRLWRSGTCAGVGWEDQVALSFRGAGGGLLRDTEVLTSCQGYCGFNTRKIIFEQVIISTFGDYTGGQGFNTLGEQPPLRMQFLAMLRMNDTGNDGAVAERQETFTSDGGGGLYAGGIRSYDVDALTFTVSNVSAVSGNTFPDGVDGVALVIMNGTSAGAWGTGTAFDAKTGVLHLNGYIKGLELDAANAFAGVYATIVPYKGRIVLAGGAYHNGTTLQIFGTGHGVIMSDNFLSAMTRSGTIHPGGINVWGRAYQGGQQPLHQFEVRGNRFRNATGINVISDGGVGAPSGVPYNLGVAVRRNTMSLASNLTVRGNNEGVLMGANSMCDEQGSDQCAYSLDLEGSTGVVVLAGEASAFPLQRPHQGTG